ncbi:hypothetical protein SAMN03159423_0244 [Bradyrhizobium sp. NFR13]|uniref:hypothetical protein n=1 Tax=Bradyrhizobium sp. NFR13 TaxID=1566285 RepID=UPI0008E0FC42|nr:hypothetical protein [Bradyrhizobium sp. NFR13]SFM25958.1 hypothetical protein SAMN03159423_0244 [Bradyrhizobium sp. NFR13]
MADPSSYAQFLTWMEINRIGDLSGVAGIAVSLIGFTVTVVGVLRSKGAAERAENAAKSARDSIRLMDTVVDFTAAISALTELKRMHRSSDWALLLDRYGTIRRILVTAKTGETKLTESQLTAVQTVLSNLIVLENNAEKALAGQAAPNTAKMNASVNVDIDNLLAVLTELKMLKTGN